MPGKMARSAPRPPFGLPELTVAVGTSLLSCRKAVKREYSRQFGSHPGIPTEILRGKGHWTIRPYQKTTTQVYRATVAPV